ncbi:HPr family phosphocarrier protein [Segnochrobactrum spirostomi]|uniref:HPr family phosphocarrier protein n=1 Tax=Segnochrobactrum spirostomi TaxID=2608987 RepID=UPI0028B10C32|nr:HPr family phosphocarrier protein [Segnochrobactrum spirostomi]
MVLERTVIVRVRDGLHARPATQFVKLAKSFQSKVEIVRGGRAADAKSSVKLMLLGVKEEDEVTLRADGDDAEAALTELVGFVQNPDAEMPAVQAAAAAPAAPAPAPAVPPPQP